METSLIGKALNFGFNEYGFESHVSKIHYSHGITYLINQIKIGALHRKIFLVSIYTTQIFNLLIFLKKIKYINFFYIFKKKLKFESKNLNKTNLQTSQKTTFIKIYPFYHKTLLNFHSLKIMTRPSTCFFISLKALKLIEKRSDPLVLLISTSKGIMPHSEAIAKGLAGYVFAYYYS